MHFNNTKAFDYINHNSNFKILQISICKIVLYPMPNENISQTVLVLRGTGSDGIKSDLISIGSANTCALF